jgi:crotonobetainyl-CoA:carnitine CoA-transferase CaiB-like acyl-CoA transferase
MRAFEGIRVLDFTHVFAGPFATFQLGVMGAEVIKIEPPNNPDMMRELGANTELNQQGIGLNFQVNNQGKKAISLNLKHPDGLEIARQLITTADVLVENYTHGLNAIGLGPEDALAINPQLIYCEMSGFGRNNIFGDRPAYDTIIQAVSGMMSVNGEASQARLRVGPPLVDYGTGAQAAFAISAALFQRSRTGKGQVIEVNMLDAAMMMMSPQVADAIHRGKTDQRGGNNSPDYAGYAVFPCEDDDLMIGAFSSAQHAKLFQILNLGELIQLPDLMTLDWLRQHSKELRELMLPIFTKDTAAQWEQRLNEHDIPAARVRDMYDMLSNEQSHRAPTSQFQRNADREITSPIAAFNFAKDGPALDTRCAEHGEDTNSVLVELGLSTDRLIELRKIGAIY